MNKDKSELVIGGTYLHYKNKKYKVIAVVRHSETLEEMVMYEALYRNDNGRLWVRPKGMFLENVKVGDYYGPRFRLIGTPLTKVKNIGPITHAELDSMGLHTLEELKKLGWEDLCRRYVLYFPDRLNANAFLGMICTVEDTVWTKADASQRKRARDLVSTMKFELGITKKTPRPRKAK